MSTVIDGSASVTINSGAILGITSGTVNAGGANPFNNTLTAIDFTALPSWIKRITVMFNAVSTSGTSNLQLQLGTGSTTYTTSGYAGAGLNSNSGTVGTQNYTTGLATSATNAAAAIIVGHAIFTNVSGNIWTGSLNVARTDAAQIGVSSTTVTLAATLTAVRITTVNGTDTFDAGSINILYE